MLQGDVPHAEELSEHVGRLGGKDVEQGHPAVQASQRSLAAKELPETEQPRRYAVLHQLQPPEVSGGLQNGTLSWVFRCRQGAISHPQR